MNTVLQTPDDITNALLTTRPEIGGKGADTATHPSYSLGDPWLFTGMEYAVERIQQAIVAKEHIGIFADYDCDGIPAAVVLLDLCKQLGHESYTHIYIPDRHTEGYGLSDKGVDVLIAKGVTLIITVDLGITAHHCIESSQKKGMTIIVTDHHTPLATFPPANAVIHPMHGNYPAKELCGAGVAFMLVRAFIQRYGAVYAIPEGWEKWLLDIVGFATISDMVPLIGENRILAWYGMLVMKKTRRIGIRTICAQAGISIDSITEQDLSFSVAPRLNAASRMASPMIAFELLATDSHVRAQELAMTLFAINEQRKKTVLDTTTTALEQLTLRAQQEELPPIVVIGSVEWRPAVLGLVANKLQEAYGRSFFVWGEAGDGTLKGSCRMMPHHHAALLFQKLPEEILLHAGGHQAAGGFATTIDRIGCLEKSLNEIANLYPFDQVVLEKNDFFASLAIVSKRHYDAVRAFAPFGVGNTEPEFIFEHVEVVATKMFGKQKEHFECTLSDGTVQVTGFMFFVSQNMKQSLQKGSVISCRATLDPGYRGGIRLHIKGLI